MLTLTELHPSVVTTVGTHLFIHAFTQHFLGTHPVTSTVLGAGDTAEGRIVPALHVLRL